MASLWILALALCAGAVSAVPALKQGRILAGDITSIEEYPSMVQVEFLIGAVWDQICSAVIINNRYMLSIAQCFIGQSFWAPESRRMRIGATYRNTGGAIFYVERAINHPSYGQLRQDGDISVIRVSSPIIYSPAIQRASIPAQGAIVHDNLPVQVTGWGSFEPCFTCECESSHVLRDVTIYTVNHQLCTERYASLLPRPGVVTENMICAGNLGVGGKGPCQGDAGSPLYYSKIVIGLVSWSQSCGNETFPAVTTAVASYTDWIVANAV